MTIIDLLKEIKRVPQYDRNPVISNDDLDDLIYQVDMDGEIGRYDPYPILGTKPQQYIPRGLLMAHESQAWKNHGQSLSQLARRGGLGWSEALAIIDGKSWKNAEHNENVAEGIVRKLATEFMKGKG